MPYPISDRRRAQPVWDIDVLSGTWPRRRTKHELSLPELMARVPLAGATVGSLRAALFDAEGGNRSLVEEVRADPRLAATFTVDLRNPLNLPEEIERARERGVRVLRLFPAWQEVGPSFPALTYTLRAAAEAGLSVLMDGEMREYHSAIRGLGLDIVFLDVHAYHVADFILLGRQEPTVRVSTRLLNGPDSIARVVGELGAHRVLFGSRGPVYWTLPPLRSLQCNPISDEEYAAVAHDNAAQMAGAR